MMGVD
jgi:DNA-binding NarL/FixJ family response regulator